MSLKTKDIIELLGHNEWVMKDYRTNNIICSSRNTKETISKYIDLELSWDPLSCEVCTFHTLDARINDCCFTRVIIYVVKRNV